MGLCGVKDPSLALRMTVVGSGGQRGVDENRYEQKKDRKEKNGYSKEAKGYSMGKSGASGSKMANFMMDGAKIRSVWRKMKTVIQYFL